MFRAQAALDDASERLSSAGYGVERLENGDALAVDPWRTAVRLTLA